MLALAASRRCSARIVSVSGADLSQIALTERESYIRPIVFYIGVAHQIEEAWVVRQHDSGESLGLALRAKRLPLGAARGHLADRPALRGAFGVGDQNGIETPFADHEATARECLERRAGPCALRGADDDEASAPCGACERGRKAPRILIVARQYPQRVGARSLQGASIGEQFAHVAAEPELGSDLHPKAMLATA